MSAAIEAVDFFAGHGWGVAMQRLGIREHGVELMPEAVATREANGMRTWMQDVWDVLEKAPLDSPEFRSALFIASPPCQTFSMAGSGAGRRALDEVVGLIHDRAYLDPAKLRAFGEKHDPRTALVLTPLAYVARHAPMYVAFEQVPTVLPVWEACAEVMRAWGYSVWTGNLQAEMYGVPQTRKRAVLIARADGKAAQAPTPTHSRYYSTGKKKGTYDEGVLPWVSMADALGWGRTARPSVKRGERTGDEPAPTMTSKADRNLWMSGASGTSTIQRPRAIDEPAHTVTGAGNAEFHDSPRPMPEKGMRPTETARVTIEEAAALQSYPEGFVFAGTKGKQFLQIGNAVPPLLAESILRELLS